jgi:hypothetical protein
MMLCWKNSIHLLSFLFGCPHLSDAEGHDQNPASQVGPGRGCDVVWAFGEGKLREWIFSYSKPEGLVK